MTIDLGTLVFGVVLGIWVVWMLWGVYLFIVAPLRDRRDRKEVEWWLDREARRD